MLDEKLEFQICCYADGSATEEECRIVEAALTDDPDARSLLDEYQSLIAAVRDATDSIPHVRWHGLALHLSSNVSRHAADMRLGQPSAARLGRYPKLALAASVVIAAGLAVFAAAPGSRVNPTAPTPAPLAAVPQIEITGPVADAPTSPPQIEVSVGPADSAAEPAVAANRLATQVFDSDLVADAHQVRIARSDLASRSNFGN